MLGVSEYYCNTNNVLYVCTGLKHDSPDWAIYQMRGKHCCQGMK